MSALVLNVTSNGQGFTLSQLNSGQRMVIKSFNVCSLLGALQPFDLRYPTVFLSISQLALDNVTSFLPTSRTDASIIASSSLTSDFVYNLTEPPPTIICGDVSNRRITVRILNGDGFPVTFNAGTLCVIKVQFSYECVIYCLKCRVRSRHT
jgi:hypothetical protein